MEQDAANEAPGTVPLQVFQRHEANIVYLLRGILRDVEQLHKPLDAVQQAVADAVATAKASGRHHEPLVPSGGSMEWFDRHLDEFRAIQSENVERHSFLFDWMLVMLVTFAEAYLNDVLKLLATARPTCMRTKQKIVSGDDVLHDVLKVGTALPTELHWQGLMGTMRQRWSDWFLRGKPEAWISRLEKLEAPKYRAGLAKQMNSIGDRRHAIVHAAQAPLSEDSSGLIDSAETARYVKCKSEFTNAMTTISGFVEVTDAFVMDVLNRQSTPTSTPAAGKPKKPKPHERERTEN